MEKAAEAESNSGKEKAAHSKAALPNRTTYKHGKCSVLRALATKSSLSFKSDHVGGMNLLLLGVPYLAIPCSVVQRCALLCLNDHVVLEIGHRLPM